MVDLGLTLATAAVKVACKIWLRDHEIAADASVEVADILRSKIANERDRRKVQRQFDQLEETVADRIMTFLGHEFRGLDEGERAAAILLVRDVLHHARLTDTDLFDVDLDPIYLERYIRRGNRKATRDLSEVGTALYDRLLAECCTDIVELATALPEFSSAAFTEILRRETKLIDMVRELLDRVPAREVANLHISADAEFAGAYRAQIVNRLDRLRLYGVTHATQRYPLSVAYISLNVEARDFSRKTNSRDDFEPEWRTGPNGSQGADGPVRIEYALERSSRLLIRGEAGSGKTTLLQWLAVRSARYDFDEPLTQWNALVPFFVQLRNYTNHDLPEPADFVRQIGRHLADTMPQSWVTELMHSGLAVLLIDGVDELPVTKRDETRRWLVGLIEEFPKTRYVVTSRPAAVGEGWLGSEGFLAASLEPMSPADVTSFVSKWHEAIRSEIVDSAEYGKLEMCERNLQEALGRERRLRQLATNPLMCALLCALHRDRQGNLPHDRIETYDAALSMLLERRDSERGVIDEIPGLTKRRKLIILQALAYWLMRNGWSNGPYEGASVQVRNCLFQMSDVDTDPSAVLQNLLERSGVLREPSAERIDFIHRTFQEYLAARAAVDAGDLGVLLLHAHDDQWQEVFVLAAGYAGDAAREELLKGLLSRAEEGSNDRRDRLHIIAFGCLETAPQMPVIERNQIEKAARRLLPPGNMVQAEALAKAGEFAIGLLMKQPIQTAKQAAATIRTASLIGGSEALQLIRSCGVMHTETVVKAELIRAWPRFDIIVYARDVLAETHFHESFKISDPAMLPALQYIQPVTLTASFPEGYGDISSIAHLSDLKNLTLDDVALDNLKPLQGCVRLESLELRRVASFNFGDLRRCRSLRKLDFHYPSAKEHRQLRLFEQLTELQLSGVGSFTPVRQIIPLGCKLRRFGMLDADRVADLRSMSLDARLSELEFLALANCTSLHKISGIETWAETLTHITLHAPAIANLRSLGKLVNLNSMNIMGTPVQDLSFIVGLDKMHTLHLGGSAPKPNLAPLLALPQLKHLYLYGRGYVNLAQLRGKKDLQVHLDESGKISGSELLGPGSRVIHDNNNYSRSISGRTW